MWEDIYTLRHEGSIFLGDAIPFRQTFERKESGKSPSPLPVRSSVYFFLSIRNELFLELFYILKRRVIETWVLRKLILSQREMVEVQILNSDIVSIRDVKLSVIRGRPTSCSSPKIALEDFSKVTKIMCWVVFFVVKRGYDERGIQRSGCMLHWCPRRVV